MRISAIDPTLYLLDSDDIQSGSLPDGIQTYQTHLEAIIHWAHTYLCQPHAALGREGPVCPYTQTSLERKVLWLTVQPGPQVTLEDVYAVIMKYREWFLELEPTTGKEALYKSILVLFPDLPTSRAPRIIDTIQSTLKPEFVAKGLMIGQFHATCNEPALWNPNFRPLRTPIPLLAIRYMVPTDFPFLKKDPNWLAMYLQRFGGSAVPPRLHDAVRDAALKFGLEFPQT